MTRVSDKKIVFKSRATRLEKPAWLDCEFVLGDLAKEKYRLDFYLYVSGLAFKKEMSLPLTNQTLPAEETFHNCTQQEQTTASNIKLRVSLATEGFHHLEQERKVKLIKEKIGL